MTRDKELQVTRTLTGSTSHRTGRESLSSIKRRKVRIRSLVLLVMSLVAILWLLPILFAVSNSFKTIREVMITPLSLPSSLYLGNYVEVLEKTRYLSMILNSLYVTILTTIGTILISSMAGYGLARMNSRRTEARLSLLFYLSVMIPFQAIMICLVKIMADLHLTNSLFGLVLNNIGLGSPVAIFLYAGATRSIPHSLDESASMDGAGTYPTFFRIIFPCLSSITSTVAVFTILGSWNDFLKPSILISQASKMTLPVGTYQIVTSQYGNKPHLLITTLVMAAIPMIIVFLFLQRFIISGITQGAVKE